MIELTQPSELVRAVLAMQAVNSARAFLPLIRMQSDSQCGAILYGALCTYYARPFTHSDGLGRLPLEFVPDEFRSTHDKLRRYRNKVAAHSDSGLEHDGVSVNSVYFRSDGKQVIVEDRHLCPNGDFLTEVERLFDCVRSRLSDAVTRCLYTGPASRTAYPPGLYQLRVDGWQEWNFVAVPDDGLAGDEASAIS